MTSIRALPFFLLVCGQDAGEVHARLLDRCASIHPAAAPEERSRIAEGWTRRILAVRDFGHDPSVVLDHFDWTLAQGSAVGSAAQATAASLSEGIDRWVPDVRQRLALPDDLLRLERARVIDVAEAYLQEVVVRPRASDADRAAIREQFERVREEIRAAARSKIHGAYGEKVLGAWLDLLTKDQLGEDLGNPVEGALSRPLTEGELDRVLQSVRKDIGAMEPVEASSEADRVFAESGRRSPGVDSPAIRAASAAAHRLFLLADTLYPRHSESLRRLRRTQLELVTTLDRSWAGVVDELKRQGAKVTELPTPREVLGPKATAGGVAELPSATTPDTRSPAPEETRTSSRLPWIVAVLAAAGLILLWTARRKGARPAKPGA